MTEQDFACGEREVEVWSLRHDADQSLHLDRLCPDLIIADRRLTRRRPHAGCKDADGCRFAGAVWTKQPEDLAASHVERQSIERNDLARRLLTFAAEGKPATRGAWRGRCVDFAQIARANSGWHVASVYRNFLTLCT